MRAVLCKAFGPPESLVVEDVPAPKLGPKKVRIRVHAAGLNFFDTLMIVGQYQLKPPFPFSPGAECAGVVSEVGDGVTSVKPGDRVMATTGWGAVADEVVAPEGNVFRIPARMTFNEAAGFPITYGTVYHALVDRGRLKAGEVLLVHGAAGGVGLNAVELGKILGATVIAAASSDDKLQIARRYGADHVINYSKESIRDRVKALTDDQGADVIFDPVGGDAFDQSLRCINWDGRLLVIGFASGKIPQAPANIVLIKGISVVGVYWGAFAQRDPARNRSNFDTMLGWYDAGRLKPHISMTFPLDQVPQALQALIQRKATGKVVITTGRD